MIAVHEGYRVDAAGIRRAIVLPLAVWREIQAELEERDDIRVYDVPKAEPVELQPF